MTGSVEEILNIELARLKLLQEARAKSLAPGVPKERELTDKERMLRLFQEERAWRSTQPEPKPVRPRSVWEIIRKPEL